MAYEPKLTSEWLTFRDTHLIATIGCIHPTFAFVMQPLNITVSIYIDSQVEGL